MSKNNNLDRESRILLLKKILEYFGMVFHWGALLKYRLAFEYECKAESLIELLEIDWCGSVGGFGGFDPQYKTNTGYKLYDRFEFLMYKLKIIDDDFNLSDHSKDSEFLHDYFHRLRRFNNRFK